MFSCMPLTAAFIPASWVSKHPSNLHTGPQEKKENDSDQEVVLLWCHSFRETMRKFHYSSMLNLGSQPCLVSRE